jgi:hypothetical protein
MFFLIPKYGNAGRFITNAQAQRHYDGALFLLVGLYYERRTRARTANRRLRQRDARQRHDIREYHNASIGLRS